MSVSQGASGALTERRLFRALYWPAPQANVVGPPLSFVYLRFVAPPKPERPEDERFLYLGVAPLYFLVAALIGYRVGKRAFRPIGRWLADGRAPTSEERSLVLSLPWRSAVRAAVGWFAA